MLGAKLSMELKHVFAAPPCVMVIPQISREGLIVAMQQHNMVLTWPL